MRIVFMGSDEIACPALRMLQEASSVEVVGVVTQPDRPKGRKRRLAPCDLKAQALELGLSVLNPEKVGGAESVQTIVDLQPELIVVVAYGQYIPERVLNIPSHGAINLHPSLLPKYRGASPIQQTVACGEIETGATILYVSKEMDAGDIILQRVVAIDPEESAIELGARLAELGGEMLLEAVGSIADGTVQRSVQDDAQATVVHKLSKDDGKINWTQDAGRINNLIRGYQPWPVCYCEMPNGNGAPLRIYKARVEEQSGKPGEVLSTKGEGPVVACGTRALRLLEVQPPGKKRMVGSALVCGRYLEVGSVLQ